MRRAAIFTAAFALAFATTDLSARHSIDDALFSAGEDNAINCLPFSDYLIDGEWGPAVRLIEEEILPTIFSTAQSRFDAENREIAISSRPHAMEDDHFALSNALPPRQLLDTIQSNPATEDRRAIGGSCDRMWRCLHSGAESSAGGFSAHSAITIDGTAERSSADH